MKELWNIILNSTSTDFITDYQLKMRTHNIKKY